MKYDYDYIVAGAGASGLSLLIHLINSGRFADKRILLIEKDRKTENDRTWCFWETAPGPFEHIVCASWQRLKFVTTDGTVIDEDISPYRYKLIRGIDFYSHALQLISKQPNISVTTETVFAIHTEQNGAAVILKDRRITAHYVFNSIMPEKPAATKSTYMLLQHFTGWFVTAKKPLFEPHVATLMDFRTAQEKGTSFFYLMPFSNTQALVEYTLFSPELLSDAEYFAELTAYCSNYLRLDKSDFEITSIERGSIPMTNFPFKPNDGNIINIGTAGGQTKPSSGYTFSFIQKDSQKIVDCLVTGKSPASLGDRGRNNLYDSILLNILSERKMDGADIFSRLFRTNRMTSVFKFLDNETSLGEELQIIRGLPAFLFARAAFDHLLR